jgi:hypothetical protein
MHILSVFQLFSYKSCIYGELCYRCKPTQWFLTVTVPKGVSEAPNNSEIALKLARMMAVQWGL